MGLLAIGWAYRAICPPPPKICGSPGGPPITAPRIKLRDGRNLAYKEHGVRAQVAKYKIIFAHGLSACRHSLVILKSLPQDRIPLDIEELVDQLELGSKFYVIGYSIGSHLVWGCLRYIPHSVLLLTLILLKKIAVSMSNFLF
nr:uncharacterized protein LOC112027629 [Quercus suber]